jgi:hypothetical protein
VPGDGALHPAGRKRPVAGLGALRDPEPSMTIARDAALM